MEKQILEAAAKAINEAILSELVGYNKHLSKLTEEVISANKPELYSLINDEFAQLINSKEFKKALGEALNAKLAKTLISRMGGTLEKQVNQLNADPTTRAKLTLAIEQVVSSI